MNGKKLQSLRKNMNITQKQFCDIFKISQPTLSLWENSKRSPEADTLKEIANYFQVSIDFLMDNEENIQENELTKLERKLSKEEKEKMMIMLKMMFEDKYEKKE